jgi:hypothetical protein
MSFRSNTNLHHESEDGSIYEEHTINVRENGSIIRVIHEEDMEDIQDSRVNKRSGVSQNFSEQLYSKKLTPLNLSIAQSSEAGRRQKN